MSFGMIMSNENILKKQNCVIWIQAVPLYALKQIIFIKTLEKMLKQGLILQIMN